jgi:hypothetical protein
MALAEAVLIPACASSRLADEPADLIAPGADDSSLTRLGWDISPPTTATEAAAASHLNPTSMSASDSQRWGGFVAKLGPSDELRPVRNNAGIGYAIFRSGRLVDLYLVTIF